MKLLKLCSLFALMFLLTSQLEAKCHNKGHHHRPAKTRSAFAFHFGMSAPAPVYVSRPAYYEQVTVVQQYPYGPVYMPYQQVIVQQQPTYVAYPSYSSGFSFGFFR